MIYLINNQEELESKGFDIIVDLKPNFKNPFIKYIVFEKGKKVIGYLSFEDIYDRYEIDDFLVCSEYRKTGIGTKLMDYLIGIAKNKGTKNITLEVKKGNTAAISLYKKYGFKEVAVRKNYYNGIDGILMKKEM